MPTGAPESLRSLLLDHHFYGLEPEDMKGTSDV